MNFKKIIAIITAACFTFSAILSQPIQASINLVRDAKAANEVLDAFDIPYSIGRITDCFMAPDSCFVTRKDFYEPRNTNDESRTPIVVNIQDLHCHPETQKNISQILSLLDKKYNLKKVYVEGAIGEVDTSWLCSVKDKKLKQQIADSMLNQGKLTGSEYYSIISDKPKLLFGLEEEKTYFANLIRLDKMLENQNKIKDMLQEIKAGIEPVKEKYFNAKQKRLENIINKNKKGDLNTEKYYHLLKKYADKLDIGISSYKNIAILLDLIELQKKLKYKRISREMQEFISVLKQELPYNVYNSLLEKTDNFTKLDELYIHLARVVNSNANVSSPLVGEGRVSGKVGADLSARFPDLHQFFNYVTQSQEINPIELIDEEKALTREIYSCLAGSQSEREIVFIVHFFACLEDYLTNKISAKDYEYFIKNIEKFKVLWGKYTYDNKFNELSLYFNLVNEFYSANLERNNQFIRNLPGNIEQIPSKDISILPCINHKEKLLLSIKDSEIIVTITGGFHTPGITQSLKEKDISYMVITPNVTQDTKLSSAVYEELIKEQSKMLSSASLLSSPPRGEVSSSRFIGDFAAFISGNQRLSTVNHQLINVADESATTNIPFLKEGNRGNKPTSNTIGALLYSQYFKYDENKANTYLVLMEEGITAKIKDHGLSPTKIMKMKGSSIDNQIKAIEEEINRDIITALDFMKLPENMDNIEFKLKRIEDEEQKGFRCYFWLTITYKPSGKDNIVKKENLAFIYNPETGKAQRVSDNISANSAGSIVGITRNKIYKEKWQKTGFWTSSDEESLARQEKMPTEFQRVKVNESLKNIKFQINETNTIIINSKKYLLLKDFHSESSDAKASYLAYPYKDGQVFGDPVVIKTISKTKEVAMANMVGSVNQLNEELRYYLMFNSALPAFPDKRYIKEILDYNKRDYTAAKEYTATVMPYYGSTTLWNKIREHLDSSDKESGVIFVQLLKQGYLCLVQIMEAQTKLFGKVGFKIGDLRFRDDWIIDDWTGEVIFLDLNPISEGDAIDQVYEYARAFGNVSIFQDELNEDQIKSFRNLASIFANFQERLQHDRNIFRFLISIFEEIEEKLKLNPQSGRELIISLPNMFRSYLGQKLKDTKTSRSPLAIGAEWLMEIFGEKTYKEYVTIYTPIWETAVFQLFGMVLLPQILIASFGISPMIAQAIGFGWATFGFAFAHTIVDWIYRATHHQWQFSNENVVIPAKAGIHFNWNILNNDLKDLSVRIFLAVLLTSPFLIPTFSPILALPVIYLLASITTFFAHSDYNTEMLKKRLPSWLKWLPENIQDYLIDKQLLMTIGKTGKSEVKESETLQLYELFELIYSFGTDVSDISFSPDKKLCFVKYHFNLLRSLQKKDYKKFAFYDLAAKKEREDITALISKDAYGDINKILFSNDGKLVLVIYDNIGEHPKLFDIERMREISSFRGLDFKDVEDITILIDEYGKTIASINYHFDPYSPVNSKPPEIIDLDTGQKIEYEKDASKSIYYSFKKELDYDRNSKEYSKINDLYNNESFRNLTGPDINSFSFIGERYFVLVKYNDGRSKLFPEWDLIKNDSLIHRAIKGYGKNTYLILDFISLLKDKGIIQNKNDFKNYYFYLLSFGDKLTVPVDEGCLKNIFDSSQYLMEKGILKTFEDFKTHYEAALELSFTGTVADTKTIGKKKDENKFSITRELSRKEQGEIACLSDEAWLLKEFLKKLNEIAKQQGRPLTIIENLTYGWIATLPIEQELKEMGIRVIRAKAGSLFACYHPEAMHGYSGYDINSDDTEILKPDDLDYIVRNEPIIAVIDGSFSIDNPEVILRESKESHFSDAYQTWRNVIHAISGNPNDIDLGLAGLKRRDGTPIGESLRKYKIYRAFREKISEIKPETKRNNYKMFFWYPGKKELEIGSEQKGYAIPQWMNLCNPNNPEKPLLEKVQGPALVFINANLENDSIHYKVKEMAHKAGSSEHISAYFDDYKPLREVFGLEVSPYDVRINDTFIKVVNLIYKEVKKLMEGLNEVESTKPLANHGPPVEAANIRAIESLAAAFGYGAIALASITILGWFGIGDFQNNLNIAAAVSGFMFGRSIITGIAEKLILGHLLRAGPGLVHITEDGKFNPPLIKGEIGGFKLIILSLTIILSAIHETIHKILLNFYGKKSKVWQNEALVYGLEAICIGLIITTCGFWFFMASLCGISTIMLLSNNKIIKTSSLNKKQESENKLLIDKINRLNAEELDNIIRSGHKSGRIKVKSLYKEWESIKVEGNKKIWGAGIIVIRKINGKWCFLLGQRTENASDRQGQFTIPGGKVDKPRNDAFERIDELQEMISNSILVEDEIDPNYERESPLGAAVREFNEELGETLRISSISGRLDDFIDENTLLSCAVYVDSSQDPEVISIDGTLGNFQWIPLDIVLNAPADLAGKEVEKYLGNDFPGSLITSGIKNNGITYLREFIIKAINVDEHRHGFSLRNLKKVISILDPRRYVSGLSVMEWIKNFYSSKNKIIDIAPKLADKNYVVLSISYDKSKREYFKKLAGTGINAINIAPLPEDINENKIINISKDENIGKVVVNNLGYVEVYLEKSTKNIYYKPYENIILNKEEIAQAALSVAVWLKGNITAQKEIGLNPEKFNLDIIEMDDIFSNPEMVDDNLKTDEAFEKTVMIYLNENPPSSPFIKGGDSAPGEDEEKKGMVAELDWGKIVPKIFDAEITNKMGFADRLKRIEAALKIKVAESMKKPSVSVYETIEISQFKDDMKRLINYINKHTSKGLNTFILSSLSEETKLIKILDSKERNKGSRLLFDCIISETKDLNNMEEDIIDLIKNHGAAGVRLDLSRFNETEEIHKLSDWIVRLRCRIDGINPDALMPIIRPQEQQMSKNLDVAVQFTGSQQVLRFLPGKMPSDVPDGVWLEMCLKNYRTGEYSDFRGEEQLKEDFKKLFQSKRTSAVGFAIGLLEGQKGDEVVPAGYDIMDYFFSLVRTKTQELSQSPQNRYESGRTTALNLDPKDIPDVSKIWEKLIKAMKIPLNPPLLKGEEKGDFRNDFAEKIHNIFENIPEYNRGKEECSVAHHYIERYYKMAVTASDGAEKERIDNSLAGFVRGIMEADAGARHMGRNFKFDDKENQRAYLSALVEAEILLDVNQDGKVEMPASWDTDEFIFLANSLLMLEKYDELNNVLKSYSDYVNVNETVFNENIDTSLWFAQIAGSYYDKTKDKENKYFIERELADTIKKITFICESDNVIAKRLRREAKIPLYNALNSLMNNFRGILSDKELDKLSIRSESMEQDVLFTIKGELPQDPKMIGAYTNALLYLNQNKPLEYLKPKVQEAINILRAVIKKDRPSLMPLAITELLAILDLPINKGVKTVGDELKDNYKGLQTILYEHINVAA